MGIPLRQSLAILSYVVKKRLQGVERYPLVLMLEPLFRCNLACAGCGKIDYPEEILDRQLSPAECMAAVDECGAPVVSIAGGEPLIHKDMPEIVRGFIQRKSRLFMHERVTSFSTDERIRPFALPDIFGSSGRQPRPEQDTSVCRTRGCLMKL